MRLTRPTFLTVILGLTLVLAALLAGEAIVAARYHRTTAEGVLRDYAGYALDEYTRRAEQRLAYEVYPALNLIARSAAAPVFPSPQQLAITADSQSRRSLALAQLGFRITGGGVREPGTLPSPGGRGVGGEVIANPEISADLLGWIRDTLIAHSSSIYKPEWYVALVWGTSDRPVLVYRVVWEPAGWSLVGFAADPGQMIALLREPAEKAPLLPPSLTRNIKLDSLIGITVTRADGATLFAKGSIESPFTRTKPLSPVFGGLAASLGLRPDLAGNLIIGGMPRSRMGIVLSLLGLTTLLVAIALVQLRRERELVRVRADFVSSVSHELRTPLAQLRMFAETLLLGRVRTEQEHRRSLEIMDQEARRLSHLVDNLLYFSRDGRQAVRFAPEPTSLGPLVTDVVDGFRPLTVARNMRLRIDADGAVTAPVDRAAVRQILLNLLDNAVKYGTESQVICVEVGGENGRVRLAISDQGPGVEAADRERIWERFWRLPRDRESAVAGTGLGLAIVRELTAMHGGSSWVESASGGGARFVIELPNPHSTIRIPQSP